MLAVIGSALVVVLLALAWQQRDRLPVAGLLTRGLGDQIDHATYQSVFLVGGQVYFGKLTTHGDDYVLLEDVFYLGEAGASPAPQGQLVKRGNELHGPRDPMIIPTSQVLFIENLRSDSHVAVAIQRFHSGVPGATVPPGTLAPAPTANPSPSR
jgi:hypothetical protein